MPFDVGMFFGIDSFTRDPHLAEIGYVKLTEPVITALVEHGPWVEIGAGSGAMAQAVRDAGGRIVASDNYSWERVNCGSQGKVYRCDGLRAARLVARRPSLGLFMSWPYMDPLACRAASLLQIGQKLAYIGESRSGCTADDSFFDLVEADFEPIAEVDVDPFPGIYDCMTIYRRIGRS